MSDRHDREEHIYLHIHLGERTNALLEMLLDSFSRKLDRIIHLGEANMASNAELQQSLTDLGAQLDKAKAEIVKKVSDLEAALTAAGGTTPEVDAALSALRGKVQELDDLNPDQP